MAFKAQQSGLAPPGSDEVLPLKPGKVLFREARLGLLRLLLLLLLWLLHGPTLLVLRNLEDGSRRHLLVSGREERKVDRVCLHDQ